VAGAALDVFLKEPVDPNHPLLKLDNVVLTPHLGASTAEAQDRVAREIAEQVVDLLTNETVTNAVNVPQLPGEAAAKLRPYVDLARKLGRLLAQLEPIEVQELRVTCTGKAGEFGVRPLANSLLAGYLERFTDAPVSPISAPFEAKERGIAIIEVREEAGGRYRSSVQVSVSGPDGNHAATGTIGASGEALLVGMDGYDLDARLDGHLLILQNADRPGVIGGVGTILGKREINVSRLQVGLREKQAISLWNVDQKIPDETLTELGKVPNVSSVRLVVL